jgi:RNA-directed DNA polymerase
MAQSINLVFEEIFDSEFTGSNFGFRRRRSQHRAIGHVQSMVGEGYEWCASIDLKSFFDEIPHNLILKLIRRRIADEELVTLIARALRAGVVVEGKFEKTTKGCPQGSPLSPMLSNIVLNELDHELEKRGHRYARWQGLRMSPFWDFKFCGERFGSAIKQEPSSRVKSEN